MAAAVWGEDCGWYTAYQAATRQATADWTSVLREPIDIVLGAMVGDDDDDEEEEEGGEDD
jgi:hypothetical protein